MLIVKHTHVHCEIKKESAGMEAPSSDHTPGQEWAHIEVSPTTLFFLMLIDT